MNYIVIAVIEVLEEFKSDFLKALDTIVAKSQAEPGCISYIPHQNSGNANSIFIYEKYRQESDYLEHKSSTYLAEFAALVGPMLSTATVVYRGTEYIS
jgi:quinol monooxygenase YgiN